MGKSLRSKIMRRWRKLKRGHLDNIVGKSKEKKIYQNNIATLSGIEFRQQQLKNAFLHPNDPDAEFPQFKPAPIIDLRSTSIPGSGREWKGANRGNRTITESFKNYDLLDQEPNKSEQVEERKDQNEMKEEKTVAATSYKVKKTRKSKLRKTIVF